MRLSRAQLELPQRRRAHEPSPTQQLLPQRRQNRIKRKQQQQFTILRLDASEYSDFSVQCASKRNMGTLSHAHQQYHFDQGSVQASGGTELTDAEKKSVSALVSW